MLQLVLVCLTKPSAVHHTAAAGAHPQQQQQQHTVNVVWKRRPIASPQAVVPANTVIPDLSDRQKSFKPYTKPQPASNPTTTIAPQQVATTSKPTPGSSSATTTGQQPAAKSRRTRLAPRQSWTGSEVTPQGGLAWVKQAVHARPATALHGQKMTGGQVVSAADTNQ